MGVKLRNDKLGGTVKLSKESNADEDPHFLQSHADVNLLGFEIIGMAKAPGGIEKSTVRFCRLIKMETSLHLRGKGISSEPNC